MARTLSTTLAVIAVALVVTPAVAHDAPAAPVVSVVPVASAVPLAPPTDEGVRDIIVRRRPGP